MTIFVFPILVISAESTFGDKFDVVPCGSYNFVCGEIEVFTGNLEMSLG